MIEPNQQTSVGRLLRRKSSFEDYQRRLVDKIKRHFERRRRQWEKNIENQAKTRKAAEDVEEEEEEEEITVINKSLDVASLEESAGTMPADDDVSPLRCPVPPSPLAARPSPHILTCTTRAHTKQETSQIEILSVDRTDFPEEGKTKHTILVNIQSFLPFGSVTVRQEDKGLALIGENDSGCHCRSRGRRGGALQSSEVLIPLDGTVEDDSMLVHTTRGGEMRIEVVTSLPSL